MFSLSVTYFTCRIWRNIIKLIFLKSFKIWRVNCIICYWISIMQISRPLKKICCFTFENSQIRSTNISRGIFSHHSGGLEFRSLPHFDAILNSFYHLNISSLVSHSTDSSRHIVRTLGRSTQTSIPTFTARIVVPFLRLQFAICFLRQFGARFYCRS